MNRRHHGFQFEEKALNYLIAKGYRLLARNVFYKSGEIDLVLEKGQGVEQVLVFVEVRKRGASSFIRPEESLTYTKTRRLKSAIQQYLLHYEGHAKSIRLDLIAFHEDELQKDALIHYPDFID